ncbi:MAG: MBL fold metallo-hydrolase [Candidatus Micrarchaeota archaeon]
MELSFLGGAGEVGRSGILIDNGFKVLLDYGIKIHDETEYPLKVKGGLDAVVISHAHLDHSGFLPAVYDHYACPFFGTYPTALLAELLIKDSIKIQERIPFRASSFKRAFKHFSPLEYNTGFEIEGARLTLHDAGHITGSALVRLEMDEKTLLYTGDCKLEQTRMEKGADVPKCDVLITETTYSEREHPPRKELEKKLSFEVNKVLENGGNVLLPSFAVGRAQELLQILYDLNKDVQVYLDGMSKSASEIVRQCPRFVKNFKEYDESLAWVEWVESREQRAKALKSPSVIITTAGMLEGGPVFQYLLNLNKNSKIIMTGYCVDNTNGWHLMNKGLVYVNGKPKPIETPVEYMDFSAHAGKSDLLELITRSGPEKIFCVHGDHTEAFAEELRGMGFDANAPKIGDKFKIT